MAAPASIFIARQPAKDKILSAVRVRNNATSRDLRDACGFDDRRTPLALREPRRLFLVGINAAKRLAIRLIDGHKEMVVTPAAILAEFGLFIPDGLSGRFGNWFGHRRFLSV